MWWKTWYSGLSGLLLIVEQPEIGQLHLCKMTFSQQKSWWVKVQVKSRSVSFHNELVCRTSQSLCLKWPLLSNLCSAHVFLTWNIQSCSCKQCQRNKLLSYHIQSIAVLWKSSVSKCFHHIQECPSHLADLELVYTNELPFALQLPPTI